jgi:hypothetical protein
MPINSSGGTGSPHSHALGFYIVIFDNLLCQNVYLGLGVVVPTRNPSYLGGRHSKIGV